MWVVVGLLVLVLVLSLGRERFETYEDALKDVGQTSEVTAPPEPADSTPPNAAPSTPSEAPTSEIPITAPPGEEAAAPASPPGSAGVGTVTGTTTGGASAATFGPTSGGGGTGRTVWGPVFPGFGEGKGPVAGDSTKSNVYPMLLGGLQGRDTALISGVGTVPPSGAGLGGVLPSLGSLGAGPNSMFLPYSREPGDQDLIPDPYRLARNFSTSSYTASKTDPVPFLTDFSAFYK